jgi:HlyD family secretion protein/epimerase transport system membrane fusion protein
MAWFKISVDETGEATNIVRSGMFVVVFFIGGFLAWGYWAPISGAVVAEGMVKVDSKRKTIQHLEGGVIKDILVREGEYVKSGQTLLILQDAEIRSTLTILQDQLNAERVREARLLAEKKFADSIRFPAELQASNDPKVHEMLTNEQSLFLVKKKSLDQEVAMIRDEIAQAKQEEASTRSQIEAANENIAYKQQRVASGEVLSAKQYLEKSQFLELKESLAEKRESLNQLQAQLASIRQHQLELDLRIINRRNEYSKNADDELKDSKKNLFEVQEKIRPAELSLNRFNVVAPIAGQVIDLKVTTLGGVVRPGDPLMDIVPKEHELVTEVKVKTKDIAKVHVGQRADLQLLAYSSRSVPHVNGTVIYVSDDALEDHTKPELPVYYLAHVRVDGDALATLPNVQLAPGMPINAFIQTQPRTFLDMVLKPFEESVSRGLRS